MRKRNRTRPGLERLEGRHLLSTITSVAVYSNPTSSLSPITIAKGPDGNLWFAERVANKIGMINPTTHAVSEFAVPTANAGLWDIAAGPDGDVWFTERSAYKIGMINPTTHAITEFNLFTTNKKGAINPLMSPIGITAGPDGNVWFAGSHEIGTINLNTKLISYFASPSGFFNSPMWITAGPDGNVWFSELSGDHVGKINPTTHAETSYTIPPGPMTYTDTYEITAGSDGNLWFTDYNNNAIDSINPTTGVVSQYFTPETANVNVTGLTAGPDGNLWFTENHTGTIGSINPTTHVIAEYPLPAPSGVGMGIATGPDGNLWFPDGSNVGVATLSSTPGAAGLRMNSGIKTANASGLAGVAYVPTTAAVAPSSILASPVPALVPFALDDVSFLNSLVKDKNRHA